MYDLGEKLLMVASDRISAFDVVLPTPIPGKGAILNRMSMFWFHKLGFPSHYISTNVDDYPEPLHKYREYLQGRSMLVKKAKRFDVECVVRGYLAGSGWKDYVATGSVCGHHPPPGLRMSARLETPLFTPAAKNDSGHDENIDFNGMIRITGVDIAEKLRRFSLEIYSRAREYALSNGVIIADTKFEFGESEGEIILIDEVLTPDSSRFWPLKSYVEGEEQSSFDKQFVRDYLSSLDWDKTYPAPGLPQEVVRRTMEKYEEAFRLLTGST